MTKYQLGTASINDAEASVIKLPAGLFPLGLLLPAGPGAPMAAPGLFEIFSHWDDWHPKLAAAVESFVPTSSAADALDEASVRWLTPIRGLSSVWGKTTLTTSARCQGLLDSRCATLF